MELRADESDDVRYQKRAKTSLKKRKHSSESYTELLLQSIQTVSKRIFSFLCITSSKMNRSPEDIFLRNPH